jgi:dTDP-glucose 4,6-dehydratase
LRTQPEEYRSNVNPIGNRGAYDVAKRYAEALTMAHGRHRKVDTRIVRIFNTYGPRMRADDDRMVPNFIQQALLGESLSVYGDGSQTRSIQYIDDLMEGCVRLMKDDEKRPVHIGNLHEMSVLEITRMVIEITSSGSELLRRNASYAHSKIVRKASK